MCWSITTAGRIHYVDCDVTQPAFVCKKRKFDILLHPCLHLNFSINLKQSIKLKIWTTLYFCPWRKFISFVSSGYWLVYSKTCLKRALKKKTKIGFQDRISLNAGQKYCRMLQGEHSAIFSTFIKVPFVINIFVLSIFEWPLKTGFTVQMFTISIAVTSQSFSYRYSL